MSVINQMLQGVEKSVSQQKSDQATDTAVFVPPAKTNDKLVVILLGFIIVLVALSAYLFSQKNQPEAHRTNPENAVVSTDNVIADKSLVTNTAPASQTEIAKSLVHKPSEDVKQPISAKSTAEPMVNETNAVVAESVSKVAAVPAKPKVDAVPTSTLAKSKPMTPPATVVAAKLETKPKLEENNISIKSITRTPSQQAELYFRQAESALLAGDKETAKQLFNKALTFNKQHDLSREKLAAILYGEQRTKSAVKLLQAGLSISPDYTNFRLMLARIFLKSGNKSQAYYYLKPHQPEINDNIDYYAVLAGLAQSLDDLDVALVAYKKLTEYEPNRAKWWLGLGISADKAQQVELALTAYNKAQQMGQLSASSRNYMNARISQLETQL